jgi:hypothetical protein
MSVFPSYDSNTNTISWEYTSNSSLNFIDIYKLNNNIITHSRSELLPTTYSSNNYTLDITNIHLMGEQGITNANPYVLNVSSPPNTTYRLGLSGPGTTFFTTSTFTIDDNLPLPPDFTNIPIYNNSDNTISFSYSGGGSMDYVELYKVGYPPNNRRFIDASAHIVDITTISTNNYSVNVTGVTLYDKQGGTALGSILENGGTYYMGLKPTVNPFTISGFFDIVPTFWKNTFPVGGVAISGGESNNSSENGGSKAFITSGINNIETDLLTFYPKLNLIRLPIVWAYTSKSNTVNYVLFSSSTNESPSVQTDWSVDAGYLTAIVNAVTKFVNDDKVVIIDYHTYIQWKGSNLTDIPNDLATIWGRTLDVFSDPIFKNPRVWFELVNEPYTIQNLTVYQNTITTIRNKGFNNKIIMGIDATANNGIGHVVNVYSNGTIFDYGFSSNNYTGAGFSFPTDPEQNLCVTLHQYFNKNGSGSDYTNIYSSGNEMCSPTWLVSNGGTYTLTDNTTTIKTVVQNITTMCKANNCDILLGEFGYDNRYSPNVGRTAVTTLLDAMKQVNDDNVNADKNSTTILTKTQGGVWLGFAAWQYHYYPGETPLGNNFLENYIYDSMFNDVYSQYFI